MNRTIINSIIDGLSLILFSLVISTGLLLEYVLPPGSGRIEMMMRGRGQGHQSILVFLDLTRHEWGNIHLILALALLFLIVVHAALHWKWIYAIAWKQSDERNPWARRAVVVLAIFIITGSVAVSVVATPECLTRYQFLEQRMIGGDGD